VRRTIRWSLVVGSAAALVAAGIPAQAEHATRPHTKNMHAKGHSEHLASFTDPAPIAISSDIAFWGNMAFQGNYDGFRVIDISDPDDPVELAHPSCQGDQGDLVVWENILVRSWNSPAPPGRTCLGEPVTSGWEGVHVFDISDPTNPTLEASVELECGSHTVTVTGIDEGELIIYSNNSSSVGCAQVPGNPRSEDDPLGDFMDVIAVPLDDLGGAYLDRREELEGPTTDIRTGCHDAGVILGDVNKAACASADTINVWDIGNAGGTLRDPELLFTIFESGVGTSDTNGRWHSAAFTWDGEVLVMGWEPGGGGQAECEASDPPEDKSMFFYDADTGAKLGTWVLPRPQGPDENCTVHNYNVVPLRDGRYVAVSGNYQAGTWATEFTDPANPQTVGWSDPPSLGPGPFCTDTSPPGCQLGGAWSSYSYNNFIYESDITTGLNVFRLSGMATRGAMRLPYLNPQTQPFSM
jgi:hypothetical protein